MKIWHRSYCVLDPRKNDRELHTEHLRQPTNVSDFFLFDLTSVFVSRCSFEDFEMPGLALALFLSSTSLWATIDSIDYTPKRTLKPVF